MKKIAVGMLALGFGMHSPAMAQMSVDEALGQQTASANPDTSANPAAAANVTERNTPGLPDYLVTVDEAIPGALMNDPTALDWVHYGDHLKRENIVNETYPGGAALRVSMSQSGQAYAGGMNVPLLAEVKQGERITVGFYARTIQSAADNGMGKVAVRFQENRAPYPGFGDKVLDITSDWKWYEVTAVADRHIRKDAIVALQFGLARQTVEIGQTIVVVGTSTIAG